MILVTLGTQDKEFTRLLDAIEREIKNKNIKEKVIVQAGHTKYKSKHMEIFDYISMDEFEELMKKCNLLITHGGVGSIISGLEKKKPVIAAARLEKYKEHTNDHQIQIIEEFTKEGYILELKDFNKLDEVLKKAKTFKGKSYKSNTHNMVKLLDKYIEENTNQTRLSKYREQIMYLIFGFLTVVINLVSFYLLDKIGVNVYINNSLSWIFAINFAFFTNKKYVFLSNDWNKEQVSKEGFNFVLARAFSYLVDMLLLYFLFGILSFNKMLVKIFINIVVIIINYVISKKIIFKKV